MPSSGSSATAGYTRPGSRRSSRKVAEELEDKLKSAGEQAVFDAGVHNVHPEMVKLLGRLKIPEQLLSERLPAFS